MAKIDITCYLRIAQADLLEAWYIMDLSGFRDSRIGFLPQQACKKALRRWIRVRCALATFTHGLVKFMDWLRESGIGRCRIGLVIQEFHGTLKFRSRRNGRFRLYQKLRRKAQAGAK
jgi:hypothetical protein